MPERLYTVAEAAEYLGISPVTVKRYIRTGMLNSVKFGHQRRVGESDLTAFIDAARTAPATPKTGPKTPLQMARELGISLAEAKKRMGAA